MKRGSWAELLVREALAIRREVFGNQHPDTLGTVNNLGGLLVEEGKLTEAKPLLREALACNRETLGNGHPDTVRSINKLGHLLRKQGKKALARSRGNVGSRHPTTLH